LVRESLAVLVESSRDFEVINTIGFDPSELSKFNDSDIAVIYLEPGDPVEIVGEVHANYPRLKIVAITDGDDLDSSTRALQFGAVGVVQSLQGSNLLFEAIRQASKGETWLNQKLLSNLLENGHGPKGSKTNGRIGPANDSLTPREVEVVSMIGKGLKSKTIAEGLSISEATVRHHLSSIYGKLGVDDRLNLVIYAYEKGLVRLGDDSHEG
jgi:DNA-binding NarL/FixJ family response regulator